MRKYTWYNDIALLKLQKPARLNQKVGIVCLPKENEPPTPDMICYVTGQFSAFLLKLIPEFFLKNMRRSFFLGKESLLAFYGWHLFLM